MARQAKLIEPINASMEEVAMALIQPKPKADNDKPASVSKPAIENNKGNEECKTD